MASPNLILTDLAAVLGPGGLVPEADILKRYKSDWPVETADPQAQLAVARPETTPQEPEVIKSCGQLAVSVVQQDRRSGLAGGAVPSAGCIILSLENITHRNGQPRCSDKERGGGRHAWAGAGCGPSVTHDVCTRYWIPRQLYYLWHPGHQCRDNPVLKYGMARDLMLGLEVVLANGAILTS